MGRYPPCHPCVMAKRAITETNELRSRFARAVRDARVGEKLSQSALAERVKVSTDHVSKIEREVYQPSLEMAARLILDLGLDANAIIKAKPVERQASRRRLEAEAELERMVENLDDGMVDTLIDVARSLERRRRGSGA